MAATAITNFISSDDDGLVFFKERTGEWMFPNEDINLAALLETTDWVKHGHYSCAGVDRITIRNKKTGAEKGIFAYSNPRNLIYDSISYSTFRKDYNYKVIVVN